MTNKKFWFGLLVMVLVFGMMVAGCDNNTTSNGGDGIFQGTSFLGMIETYSETPTLPDLFIGRLTEEHFEEIKIAAEGFQGWKIFDRGFGDELMMIWTGRGLSDFTSVAYALETLFEGNYSRGSSEYIHYAEGDTHFMEFFPQNFTHIEFFYDRFSSLLEEEDDDDDDELPYFPEDIYIPQGTIMAYIWRTIRTE